MAVVSKASFDIPFVENVHTTIHAFLRTSEFGKWEVDDTQQNDAFVLNYRRGKAIPPPSRLRWLLDPSAVYDYARYVAEKSWDGGKRPPMELTVSLRPIGEQRIKIQLAHRIVGPHANLIAKAKGRLVEDTQAETRALMAYLKESYSFPELSGIVKE